MQSQTIDTWVESHEDFDGDDDDDDNVDNYDYDDGDGFTISGVGR